MLESTPKELAATIAKIRLECLLRSEATLDFTPATTPRVSIVMLVYNRAEVTLSCLQSLLLNYNETPFELIVVDNGSTDDTYELCRRLRGVKILHNADNEGFPRAVNQGVALAEAEYLLLLKKDTEVLGSGLDEAIYLMDQEDDIGVVGGRIVLLDGTLQEAGCGIYSDGWTHQYGRGGNPDDPTYNFQRDVDYCSAACLMIRTQLFQDIGQLNEDFSPGYFEDPEFSVRVWKSGHRIVYLPNMVVLHYENATSEGLFNLPEQCKRNHVRFFAEHQDWLSDQSHNGEISPLFLRSANDTTLKVLLIFDTNVSGTSEVESCDYGRVIMLLQRMDASPTVVFIGDMIEDEPSAFPTVETFTLSSHDLARQLLRDREGFYELILCDQPPEPCLEAEIERQGIPYQIWDQTHFMAPGIS